ncbi:MULTISPECIES: hypothetical protein [Halorussus]|uniref:hypothetical protein n=1 Tax=Halorussus TaxID=1070314 RepID=UPI00209DACC9|nr:hypothetical protein [Halorussus vallis]USZ75680.1 hypothetical protein NGM07_19905 [Halorussus vallis]USZ75755.1 hypothetical protein NGM07_00140 [Halorussus vallis]
MSTTDSASGTPPLTERDVRAAGELLLVVEHAPDLYHVYSEDGTEYTVDARGGVCDCDDYHYRAPDDGCKHLRRVRFATGQRELPDGVRLDPLLVQAAEEVEN